MLADVLLQVLRLLPLIFPSPCILRSHWLQATAAVIASQNKFHTSEFGLADRTRYLTC